MADNITSITGAIDKKRKEHIALAAEQGANETLDNAMNADVMPLQTLQLSRVLALSGDVYFSQYGSPELVSNEQLLHAASQQLYKFKYNDETNTFLMSFDGEYNYTLMMNDAFTPEQGMEALKMLEGERRTNGVIVQENGRRMLPGNVRENKYDPKEFLPAPLKTDALAMALKFVESVSQPKIDDLGRVGFDEMNIKQAVSELLTRAQHELFNISTDINSGYINLTMSDDVGTHFAINMKESVDPGLMNKVTDVLMDEITLNHATYREHNPEMNEIRMRMQASAESLKEMFPPDPEMDAYMREVLDNDPEYQQIYGNDERADELIAIQNSENVTSISPRRR